MHVPQTEVCIRAADGAELLRAALVPGEYVLGRDEACALRIDDPSLSQRHARLTLHLDHAVIEDLSSTNGTKVNGTHVRGPTRLWTNQKIQAGSVSIELRRVKTLVPDVSLAPSAAARRELLPEEILREKKYDIGGVVAQGGMGAILNAKEAAIERTVAMKVMLDGSSPDELVRFIAEAKVTGQLEHPNIVPVHELGVDENDQVFYTMKYVRGITLRKVLELMAEGTRETLAKYPLGTLLTIFQKVCDAVAFAHSKGVIHRDLKPENIMLGDYGEVLVMDWGLAKILKPESGERKPESGDAAAGFSDIRSPLSAFGTATMTGSVMGTPQYMAPEQARGEVETLDERADIYALGAILYHLLALRPSVSGGDAHTIVERVAAGKVDPLMTSPSSASSASASRASPAGKEKKMEKQKQSSHLPGGRIPDSLAAVVRKAMALEKVQRYASVAALQADITAYQNGFATSAENAGAWKQLALLLKRHKAVVTTSAAALLALAAFGVWFIVNLRASERVAKRNEQRAVAQEEQTRRSLAQSQVSLAEAAFRSGDHAAMVQALDSVPADLRGQLWGYLSRKRDASLGPLQAEMRGKVTAIAAVPGQPECFAIAHESGGVQALNVRTGDSLWKVSTAYSGQLTLGFSPDGQRFAVTAKGAADIRILDAGKRRRVQVVPSPSPSVSRLLISPDGNLLACGDPPGAGPQGQLSLIDLRDGSVRWQLTQPQAEMIFSPDGARLFTASHGGARKFRALDVATGKILHDINANVFSMAMNLEGTRLALGLQGGEVVLVEVATGVELRRVQLHRGEVQMMAWTAAGHLLTSGSEAGVGDNGGGRRVMRLWETDTFSPRGTFFGLDESSRVLPWTFQPASGWLLTAETPPQRWHLPVDAEAARIVSAAEQGWAVSFVSDTLLLARGRRFELGLHDVSDPRSPRLLPPVSRSGDTMSAANGRAGLVATASRSNRPPYAIKLHAADTTLALKREIAMKERSLWLDFDPPGERLLAVAMNRKTHVFATGTGQELLAIAAPIQQAVFAGSSSHIVGLVSQETVAGEREERLAIFDGRAGQQIKSQPQRLPLNALAASPDRRLVAVAGEEQVIRVLDADTLEERWSFRAHDDDITALAFHPREPILASASSDGTLKLWDYEKANLRQTFFGIDARPVMLAFSPNGRLLALEAQERVVRLFDLGEAAAK